MHMTQDRTGACYVSETSEETVRLALNTDRFLQGRGHARGMTEATPIGEHTSHRRTTGASGSSVRAVALPTRPGGQGGVEGPADSYVHSVRCNSVQAIQDACSGFCFVRMPVVNCASLGVMAKLSTKAATLE